MPNPFGDAFGKIEMEINALCGADTMMCIIYVYISVFLSKNKNT